MFLHRTLEDGSQQIGIGGFGCSLKSFQKLFPKYQLEAPYVIREYVPGFRHKLQEADGTTESGKLHWPEGDDYLKRAEYIEGYMTALDAMELHLPFTKDQAGLQVRLTTVHPDGSKHMKSQEFSDGYRAGLKAR